MMNTVPVIKMETKEGPPHYIPSDDNLNQVMAVLRRKVKALLILRNDKQLIISVVEMTQTEIDRLSKWKD